jgi:hypothetical protein
LLSAKVPVRLDARDRIADCAEDSMGDKSPKAKERDKKQKTTAKESVKAIKAAQVAAKAKK